MEAPRYLLDTNLLLHCVRQGASWRQIQTRYQLFIREPTPLFSIVSAGEIRSLAKLHNWGPAKLDKMEFALGYFEEMFIDNPEIVEAYASIDSHFQSQGRMYGKNDLWIAATAMVTGALLLTTDRDFDAMDPLFIKHEWIDPT
jgi:tRNA(fMet)-specific endonuclease VapC